MNRLRVPASSCALLFLFCELISRPYAEMGVCDDWSYVPTAVTLARTGHLVYNGWATAMLGWQLYLAALLVKAFGASFSVVRFATLLIGMGTAFLLQRIFVRMGCSERNAVLGTLALVFCPLFMLLSATFMTDVPGVFALCVCIYGCLRALDSATVRAQISWLCFAGAANVVFGTSRQIAWLGVLAIVPSTAWALRKSRDTLFAGLAVWLVGGACVAGCMHWFQLQPYSLPESPLVKIASLHQVIYTARQMLRGVFEVPFLILPLLAAFLPEVRRQRRGFLALLVAASILYAGIAVRMTAHHGAGMMLEPLLGDWINVQGFYGDVGTGGPQVLGIGLRATLTAVSLTGVFCVAGFLLRLRRQRTTALVEGPAGKLPWAKIGWLLGPFTLAYLALLIPRATGNLLDRYLLPLAMVAAFCVVRAYQDFVAPRLPAAVPVMILLVALFSMGATHDMFAYDRARIALAQEVASAGVPDTALDGGFEYNGAMELRHAGHINDKRLINPAGVYVPVDSYRGWTCSDRKETDPGLPHLMPQYGIAFLPDACHGAAPFAPVSYFRWLGMRSTNLYMVRYGPMPAR